ncbi:MAG: class I SAM-dependent methyltransferase [Balneolaceae bacterium]
MEISEDHTHITNSNSLERYYRFHSNIYDATRWAFLFGRNTLLDMISDMPSQPHILEIGCGTGTNIESMQFHFPDAHILGIDLSQDMLEVARNKLGNSNHITFENIKYGSESLGDRTFDLILLSYSLTMFDDPLEKILEQISEDLKSNGYIAVVDFNTSPYSWFRKWMGVNHVDLSGHLLPMLEKYYRPVSSEIKSAYFGLWSYFQFIGRLK